MITGGQLDIDQSTASPVRTSAALPDLFGVRRHVSVPRSRLRSRRLQAFDGSVFVSFVFKSTTRIA